MPDTKSPGDNESSETKKGGPKRLVMIAALCVGLLGGGYVLGGKMGAPAAVADDGTAESTPDEESEESKGAEVGEVIDLEAVNVNLADNHYLRVAISIGLAPADGGGGHGGDDEEFKTAPASDLLLSVFSGRLMEDLATPEGRDEARLKLLADMHDPYHGEVTAVYFTEFVMQ